MKSILLIISCLFITGIAYSQQYHPEEASSKVHFVIKNFGIKTGGDFTGLKGSVVFDPKNLDKSKMDVTVDAASVDTDNNTRDSHLRKKEYFDAEKYPLIRFVSTRITQNKIVGRFYIFGTITIKGVPKSVEFGFSATALSKGYLFKGEFTINRRDFGVGGSSISLSDNLTVLLSVTAD
jgi:polyisoprenoid-binding protein YceI